MIPLTDAQIRWFRQRRCGLVSPFASPEEAAAALGGVQAQILSAALLALWNRSAAGAENAEALTSRLFEARTLVRLWGQRHTLHLYASQDWPIIHASFAGRRTWWERQAALGKDIDLAAHYQGVAAVGRLLKQRGTLSRKQLRASGLDLPTALLSPWGGVFAELVRIGAACLARWEGGEARYAHREHWLPGLSWTTPSAPVARAELAHRYFTCYGPAAIGDFAYWLGLPVTTVLAGSDVWRQQLVPVTTEGVDHRKLSALAADLPGLEETPPAPAEWPVRLLGRFDPLLLAHRDKDWVVPAKYYNRVWRPAGHIEGVVLDQCQAVATWRYDRIGTEKLSLRVFPFRARLPMRVSKAIRRQARGVAKFFGLQLTAVTFQSTAT